MANKKKGFWGKTTALTVGGLVVGTGAGFVLDDADAGLNTDLVELQKLFDELNLDYENLNLENIELSEDLKEALDKLELYKDVIDEAILEDTAEVIAKEYLEDKDYKLVNWLNEEFDMNIEDEDHIDLSRYSEFEVDAIDYDDGDYDVEFEVRVDYYENDDEDEDGHKYIKVFVEVRDGEAEDISFSDLE